MNSYWRWIAGVFGSLVLIGLLLPSRARVERETLIEAHPATVFALLNDLRQVDEWAPVGDADPNARLSFSGPLTGVGATINWSGQIIGQGRQSIVESVPYERVVYAKETATGRQASETILLSTAGDGTRATWIHERDFGFNLGARYLGLLQGGIVGRDLEEKLAGLAEMAGGLPHADFSDLQVERIVVAASDIAWLRATSVPEAGAVSEAMSDAFYEILNFIDANGLQEAGAPLSITRGFSGSKLVFDAAIPVRGLTSVTPADGPAVKIGKTYAGPVIRARHVGAYASLGQTHDKIAAYLAATGMERNGDAWESYVSDPGRTDESGLLTYVYYPIRN